MQRIILLALALCLGVGSLPAQSDDSSGRIYYHVTKLSDTDGNLMQVENTLMLPYFQTRVNEGSQLWHGFYRLKSPTAGQAGFDYISVDVYDKLAELNLSTAGQNRIVELTFPHTSPEQFWERIAEVSEVHSEITYAIAGALFPASTTRGEPSAPLLSVNYMLVPPGKEAEYVRMENEVFKPIMAQHVRRRAMENWSVFERVIPIGTDFGANFATVDAYADWDQVQTYQESWDAVAAATHPDLDMGAQMEHLNGLRERTRMEVWELLRETTPPATESISFQVIQEGSGPKPMRGQEVTWSGKVMNARGETLFETASLGENWQDIVGSDPSNTRWNTAVMMVGAGGSVQVTVPVEAQSFRERMANQGQPLILKINLLAVGPPANYGHERLKKILTEEGVEAAQDWYKGLQRNNPQEYVFREFQMNALGYDLLESGLEEEAIFVFDLNVQNYPDSFNTYDSLADAYSKVGNDYYARKYFELALKKNPDSASTAAKLAELK
ncbi:L-rhamnose mutarotase [Lewinella marina]|uniref:Tetratricopeptide repeat protein n=1 Tax=Neolewinella marina TaxID=438751 RepID=A0A2G0CKB8_9BACT|nr:tetratricopeptide repeat protein [Neolewinella marina]NJB84420.1 L-rhamnose mutarotase [Neolewinella marina]PHL00388.1 hypothetical protein CGL56_04960 [Neolewinella marina]